MTDLNRSLSRNVLLNYIYINIGTLTNINLCSWRGLNETTHEKKEVAILDLRHIVVVVSYLNHFQLYPVRSQRSNHGFYKD